MGRCILYLAQVSSPRDNVPEKFKWKRIGALWMTDEGEAELHLRAWHQGDWVAVLLKNILHAPYYQGSLVSAYTDSKGRQKDVWCGRIYSHQETDSKTAYTGTLEAQPVRLIDGALILRVKQDDKE